MTVSMPPEALVVWPVNDFVLDTSGIFVVKMRFRAAVSEASLLGVPVPWALTYWISSGCSPAIARASFIAKNAPSPSSDEAV